MGDALRHIRHSRRRAWSVHLHRGEKEKIMSGPAGVSGSRFVASMLSAVRPIEWLIRNQIKDDDSFIFC
jgi:hypothetical protein